MGWGGKGNAEREYEDIHLGGSQHCHEPMGNFFQYQVYAGPKYQASMQGHLQPVWAYHDQARPK